MLLEELSAAIGTKTRLGVLSSEKIPSLPNRLETSSMSPETMTTAATGSPAPATAEIMARPGAIACTVPSAPTRATPGLLELQVTPAAEAPGFFCSLRYDTASLVFWPGESATRERSSPSVAATICTVQERGANPRAENASVVVPSCLAVSRPLALLRVAIEVSPSTQSMGTSGMLVESAASARTLNSRLARRGIRTVSDSFALVRNRAIGGENMNGGGDSLTDH